MQPAMAIPMAIAPIRKSSSGLMRVVSLGFANHSVEQQRHGNQRNQPGIRREVHAREHNAVREQDEVVECKSRKTEAAPPKQWHPVAAVSAQEQHTARQRGGGAQEIDHGSQSQCSLSFLILKALAKAWTSWDRA